MTFLHVGGILMSYINAYEIDINFSKPKFLFYFFTFWVTINLVYIIFNLQSIWSLSLTHQ